MDSLLSIFPFRFRNWNIVSAHIPALHQSCIIKLSVLVAVGTVPLDRIGQRTIRIQSERKYGYPYIPKVFHEPVIQFLRQE